MVSEEFLRRFTGAHRRKLTFGRRIPSLHDRDVGGVLMLMFTLPPNVPAKIRNKIHYWSNKNLKKTTIGLQRVVATPGKPRLFEALMLDTTSKTTILHGVDVTQ
jgi:hypothetical protein